MKTVGILCLLFSGLAMTVAQSGVAAAMEAHGAALRLQPHAAGGASSGGSPTEGVIAEPLDATLQIPNSAFAPGIMDENGDHPENYDQAQGDFSLFSALGQHRTCNQQCSAQNGGWIQRATFGPLQFEYLGNTFASSDAAQQEVRYELEATAINDTPSNCGNIYHTMCYTTQFDVPLKTDTAPPTPGTTATPAPSATPTPDKLTRYMLTMLQYNNCLVEATVSSRGDIFEAKRDVVIPTLASMIRAGYVQAQQVCPQSQTSSLDFSIVQVRAEKQVSGAAFNLSHPGLQSWPANNPVNLAVYFYVRSLLPHSKAIAEFTVERGTGVHFFFQSSPLALDKAPDTYRITVPYIPRSAGDDLILGRVSINGMALQSATTLHVTRSAGAVGSASQPPAKKATPPHHSTTSRPPQKVTAPAHQATGHSYSTAAAGFKLPLSSFPAGSQLLQSQIESNTGIASLFSGSRFHATFSAGTGRITGYYMNTVQPNGHHAVGTRYLVSLYGTRRAAATAFAGYLATYKKLHQASPAYYYALQPPVHVGDRDAMGLALVGKGGKYAETVELFFVRGDVFVQVSQRYAATDAKPYGSRDAVYLTSLASSLDALTQLQG